MKNFKLLLLLILTLLLLPFSVYADEDKDETKNEAKEVNIYFFRGEGCSHCAEAEDWFDEIEDEYGDKFNVVDYETWYNEENNTLMTKVADARGEEVNGVPYIVIGNKSWNGFADDYKDSILEQIDKEYKTAEADRYDIMSLIDTTSLRKVEETKSNDVLTLVIMVVIVGGIGFGIYKARQTTN